LIKTHDRITRDRITELEKQVEALQELVGELYDAIYPSDANLSKNDTHYENPLTYGETL